jgi:hypothetical protein
MKNGRVQLGVIVDEKKTTDHRWWDKYDEREAVLQNANASDQKVNHLRSA